MKNRREEGIFWYGDIKKWERQRQKGERWRSMVNSEYNKWYKEVESEEVPSYLKKSWGESRWTRVARFKLGCEVKKSK